MSSQQLRCSASLYRRGITSCSNRLFLEVPHQFCRSVSANGTANGNNKLNSAGKRFRRLGEAIIFKMLLDEVGLRSIRPHINQHLIST